MKRVINGLTYNTDTSTLIAKTTEVDEATYGRSEVRTERSLYQTRGGAFFIHHRIEGERKDIHNNWVISTENVFEPVERDFAQKWITEGEFELFNDQVFGQPPEAEEEAIPGSTIYLRVPAGLKSNLDQIAKEEGMSLNAWAMKCLERCAQRNRKGEEHWNATETKGAGAKQSTSENVKAAAKARLAELDSRANLSKDERLTRDATRGILASVEREDRQIEKPKSASRDPVAKAIGRRLE